MSATDRYRSSRARPRDTAGVATDSAMLVPGLDLHTGTSTDLERIGRAFQ